MSREITKLFTDVDVQQHLCRLLVKCLAVSFQLLFKNKNLSDLESMERKTTFVDLNDNKVNLRAYKGKKIIIMILHMQQTMSLDLII